MFDEVPLVTVAYGTAGGVFVMALALLEVFDHGRTLRGGMFISGLRRRSAADEVKGLDVIMSELATPFWPTAGVYWNGVCAVARETWSLLPLARVVSLV